MNDFYHFSMLLLWIFLMPSTIKPEWQYIHLNPFIDNIFN